MRASSAPTAINLLTSSGAFVFFAAMFAVLSGYSYGGALLLIASLWWLARRPDFKTVDKEDRLMAWVLLAYFAVPSLMTLALHNNPTDIDQYSRALFAVPIFLLLLNVPIRPPILWAAIILGIVLSAPLAWWQVEVEGWARAAGFLNIIHFSNLCLIFTTFCVGGLYWARTRGAAASRWRLAFTVAIFCGLYSVIVGGSRGSWVALPPVLVLFLISFLTRRDAPKLALIAVIGVAIVAGIFTLPHNPLKARYERGVQDISLYQKDDTDTSIGARFEMWRGAWQNLQQHPVSGWNGHRYDEALQKLVDEKKLTPVALQFTDNLHNNFIQAWTFTGLPGLLALLMLYATPLWHFAKRLRSKDITARVFAFCGASTVIAYICFSLTQVILRRNNGIMFYLLAVSILWAAIKHAETSARHQ